jgi:hypothetical protein
MAHNPAITFVRVFMRTSIPAACYCKSHPGRDLQVHVTPREASIKGSWMVR